MFYLRLNYFFCWTKFLRHANFKFASDILKKVVLTNENFSDSPLREKKLKDIMYAKLNLAS